MTARSVAIMNSGGIINDILLEDSANREEKLR